MTIVNDYFVNGEILNHTWGFGKDSIFIFIVSILGIIFFISCLKFIFENFEGGFFGILISLMVVFGLIICVLLFISGFKNKPIYDQIHRYEVIIEPGTDFYSIIDSYNIVERKGELFVLEENVK